MTVEPAVLDASALLALLRGEPGAPQVERLLEHAHMSTVNWSEVVQKSIVHGVDTARLERRLTAIGVVLEPFTVVDATVAAELRSVTRVSGLSLADRACLALARRLGLAAITMDGAWGPLATAAGVRVDVIR